MNTIVQANRKGDNYTKHRQSEQRNETENIVTSHMNTISMDLTYIHYLMLIYTRKKENTD